MKENKKETVEIELMRYGMDFYTNIEDCDMGNYRLRPAYSGLSGGTSELYIKTKNGHYIAGDFMIWEKNSTNNKEGNKLHFDFTEYDENLQNGTRYHGFDKYIKSLAPTLENISKLLSVATGKEVTLKLECRK